MIKSQDEFPSIKRCLADIAYDNGMVNRLETEEEAVTPMLEALLSYPADQIQALEATLSNLDEDQIFVVAADCDEALRLGLISPDQNEMLNAAYNLEKHEGGDRSA